MKEEFYAYLSGFTTTQDFEKWVYQESALEKTLGEADYLKLVAINFRDRDCKRHVAEFVKQQFDWADYLEWDRIENERIGDEIRQSIMTIDLAGITTVEELHILLTQRLRLPDFYGHNWHALWDAITGLVAMPKVLELESWDLFANRLKSDSEILMQILNRYNKEPGIAGVIKTKNTKDKNT